MYKPIRVWENFRSKVSLLHSQWNMTTLTAGKAENRVHEETYRNFLIPRLYFVKFRVSCILCCMVTCFMTWVIYFGTKHEIKWSVKMARLVLCLVFKLTFLSHVRWLWAWCYLINYSHCNAKGQFFELTIVELLVFIGSPRLGLFSDSPSPQHKNDDLFLGRWFGGGVGR